MPLLETIGSSTARGFGLNSSPFALPPVTSNLYAFYDSSVTSSMTFSGSNVTAWRDLSGNGINLESITVGKPTYSATGFNSKPGISFNGVDQGFSTVASNISFSSPGITVIIIGKVQTTTVGILAEHTVDANSGSFYFNAGSGNTIAYVNGGTASNLNVTTLQNTWAADQEFGVLSYRYDGTNAGHKVRKNGTDFATTRNPGQTGDPGFNSVTGKVYYMSRANNNIFAKGTISEIIVYKKALSDAEMSTIESYAYAKWGFGATSLVTSGLIWHLDAGRTDSYNGSGNWNDLSGSGLNGTVNATFETANGGRFSFNGSNQKISFPATSLSGLSNNTIEYLVNFNNGTAYQNVLDFNDAYGIWLAANGGSMNNSYATGSNSLSFNYSTGTWYHLAFQNDNGTTRLYRNGQLLTTGTAPASYPPSTISWSGARIGNVDGDRASEWLNGYVPIMRMYNRSLSSTEILNNFNLIKNRYSL